MPFEEELEGLERRPAGKAVTCFSQSQNGGPPFSDIFIDIFYRYDNLPPKIYLTNFPSITFNKEWGCLMARIQISNDPSGRIILSFPYDALLVEKVKSIDGRRWHPVEKHRSFEKLDGMLEKILKVFADNEVQIDHAFKTATSKAKDTPSPLAGEGSKIKSPLDNLNLKEGDG